MKPSKDCPPIAPGQARLKVNLVAGQSTVTDAYSSSPLKLLAPRSRAESVWAYTSSFGGGLLAGDQTELDVRIGAGAKCFLSTQAVTKVYRNPSALPCGHRTHAVLDKDAFLVFAPDRVQPFAGSSYRQYQEWHLAEGAGLVLLDWFCAGRSARGERWHFARFQSRNDVWIQGERVFVDSVLLDGEATAAPHRAGSFECFATLLFIGGTGVSCAADLLKTISAQPVTPESSLICSASAVRHGVVLRVAGEHSQDVGDELERHLKALTVILGDNPWIRKW